MIAFFQPAFFALKNTCKYKSFLAKLKIFSVKKVYVSIFFLILAMKDSAKALKIITLKTNTYEQSYQQSRRPEDEKDALLAQKL